MRIIISILFLIYFSIVNTKAQVDIDLQNIEIVRDDYGVPHIFTKTNLEAVYGIAWAQSEDNFHLMQNGFAASQGLAGKLMGKDGAALDFIFQVFKINDYVESKFEDEVSPEIQEMLEAYTTSINKYAETHPKEVKLKKVFPVTPKKVVASHVLQLLLMHNSTMELGKLLTKGYDYAILEQAGKGSNAFAYNPNKTKDGKTYLIGNPHQPVNSMGNFWELSVHTEEGYEMFGATFSIGGLWPAIGTNRNLGWTHTTNYHNSADIYKLEMHPTKKGFYKYDDEWVELKKEKAKLKVKIGPLVIPVKKKFYWSEYGPTFKKNSGFYSYKSNAFHNLKIIETWYKMGLAQNFEEFSEALELQGIAYQTITYADKDENIYHLSNFVHPYRNPKFDWSKVLKGNTSENNWTLDKYHPVSDLPQIKNPNCGYLYNCNNTVFKMTAPEENLKPKDFPASFTLLTSNTLRANTFEKLIKDYDKISFEEARKIRENITVDKENLSFRNCMNCDEIPVLLAEDPDLTACNEVFEKWNGSYDIKNKQASFMVLTTLYIAEYLISEFGNIEKDMPKEEIKKAILKAQKFLTKKYGTLEVELGKIQKAVRYDAEYPMPGGLNTLASTHVSPYKKNKLEMVAGDSFIFYAKYGKEGLEEMHTINAFGNSLKKGHPHNTDQTEMFVNSKTKEVQLDLEKLRASGNVYQPK